MMRPLPTPTPSGDLEADWPLLVGALQVALLGAFLLGGAGLVVRVAGWL